MNLGCHSAVFILLALTCLTFTACSQEKVYLTMHIHEGDLNGTLVSDVHVTGQDAVGNDFGGITDSNGVLTVTGEPGTWKFKFEKDGYDTLSLNYDVMETQDAAAYLTKISQLDSQVAFTMHIHEGDLNGTLLSGVRVIGQDAAGNSFEGLTDSNGALSIEGQPGAWNFSFEKEGYEPLNLNYDVMETHDAAAYLIKAPSSNSPVYLTLYVHEGDIEGPTLSGVRITGQDANGDDFEGITGSNGALSVSGQPGTWQFVFKKDGYEPVKASYDVTETQDVIVYLTKIDQSQGHMVPLQSSSSRNQNN